MRSRITRSCLEPRDSRWLWNTREVSSLLLLIALLSFLKMWNRPYYPFWMGSLTKLACTFGEQDCCRYQSCDFKHLCLFLFHLTDVSLCQTFPRMNRKAENGWSKFSKRKMKWLKTSTAQASCPVRLWICTVGRIPSLASLPGAASQVLLFSTFSGPSLRRHLSYHSVFAAGSFWAVSFTQFLKCHNNVGIENWWNCEVPTQHRM